MLTSLSLIFLVGLAMGAICQKIKLPRIIGMLATGIILGPYVLDLLDPSILGISAELRKMALIIILLKAGLSLDLQDLKKAGRSAIMKFAEMIPGLGQATGAAARLVFGSSVLIKNSLGAAAVLILAVITLVPVVKLAVLMVMYQGAAALLQPVCDKRIISCIQGMAAGHGLLLRITLYSLFLFILVIAITCAGTNVTYLAA